MRVISCIVLVFWSVVALAQGTAYRWVDEEGVVHFSDRPREGAEEVRLGRPPGFSPPAIPRAPRPATPPPPAAPPTAYESLEIIQPGQEETLWNIGGILNVSVRTRPALRADHRLQVVYDGQALEPLPAGVTSFELTDVWRGEHTLKATIVNADGQVLAESPSRTFYVQQTSIQQPQRQRP
ncbi:MAG: DUF4124 domain-containing protein [Gammaproteobacteria bacterium]|nr:DUF4124 domain-containing protein [Gammaproteobacteria bacterium]